MTIKDKIAKIIDESKVLHVPFDKMIERLSEELGVSWKTAIWMAARFLNGGMGTIEKVKKNKNL